MLGGAMSRMRHAVSHRPTCSCTCRRPSFLKTSHTGNPFFCNEPTQVIRREEYKSAAAPLTEETFTPAHRENVTSILTDLHKQVCCVAWRTGGREFGDRGAVAVLLKQGSGPGCMSVAWSCSSGGCKSGHGHGCMRVVKCTQPAAGTNRFPATHQLSCLPIPSLNLLQVVSDVAAARQLDPEAVAKAVDQAPLLPDTALELRLLDGLRFAWHVWSVMHAFVLRG